MWFLQSDAGDGKLFIGAFVQKQLNKIGKGVGLYLVCANILSLGIEIQVQT